MNYLLTVCPNHDNSTSLESAFDALQDHIHDQCLKLIVTTQLAKNGVKVKSLRNRSYAKISVVKVIRS